MTKRCTAPFYGLIFCWLGFGIFEFAHCREVASSLPNISPECDRDEDKCTAAENARKACIKAENCPDCYKVKICTTGWNGGLPGAVGKLVYKTCGRANSVKGGWLQPDYQCAEGYAQKGTDVSFGATGGPPFITQTGGFSGDSCVVVGCHIRAEGCTPYINLGYQTYSGLDCTVHWWADRLFPRAALPPGY